MSGDWLWEGTASQRPSDAERGRFLVSVTKGKQRFAMRFKDMAVFGDAISACRRWINDQTL